MKVLFLSNNKNTLDLYKWITTKADTVLYEGVLTVEYLESINPNIVISFNYSHIVSEECINAVKGRIINMHCSYLPWNRGASPNLWSFIDGTPKGVTIHMLESGLDKGDILYQKEVEFEDGKETFESAYDKLNSEMCNLFKEHWNEIASGEYINKRKRATGKGSYHSVKDLKELQSKISFDWSDNIANFLEKYNTIRNDVK